jgi:lipopolysaccharide biosynthesis glycosyltransferase
MHKKNKLKESVIKKRGEYKVVLGVCVSGPPKYWALALVTLISLKKHLNISPFRILIATDQKDEFACFQKFENNFECKFERVVPRSFYKKIFPKMKGNFAAYWKFDLFQSLSDDEILIYLDVDAFAISNINVANIINIFNCGQYKLAAVPSQRPVLERVSATQINNPFDYFNTGVLFGIKDQRYEKTNIEKAYHSIIKYDTLNLIWHDQDIFNIQFRNETFKLPYAYNVHTGYLVKNFRTPFLLNGLAAQDIKEKTIIAHVSGDFLFSKKFHPHKHQFSKLIKTCIEILEANKYFDKSRKIEMQAAMQKLLINAKKNNIDYFLQSIYMRKRLFDNNYYFSSCKSFLRRIKHSIHL